MKMVMLRSACLLVCLFLIGSSARSVEKQVDEKLDESDEMVKSIEKAIAIAKEQDEVNDAKESPVEDAVKGTEFPPIADDEEEGDEGEGEEDISTKIMEINNKDDTNADLQEGDMKLTTEQNIEIHTGKDVQGDLVNNKRFHWDDKRADPAGKWSNIVVVPYYYKVNVNAKYRSAINAAIQEYNTLTCVRFQPSRNTRTPRIGLMVGGGCYSYVGKIGSLTQDLSLGSGCEDKGIAIHEMMHALGYYHEQSRPDRDQFVQIIFANVPAGVRGNFEKRSDTTNQGTKYDYNSVMHYGSTAFGNGRTTIKRLKGTGALGQRNGLSTLDRISINKIYCNGENGNGGIKPSPQPGSCNLPSDNAFCSKVQKAGLCTNCALLNSCKSLCSTDANANCPRWARAGFCKRTYVNYMKANCKKSCGIAPTCT